MASSKTTPPDNRMTQRRVVSRGSLPGRILQAHQSAAHHEPCLTAQPGRSKEALRARRAQARLIRALRALGVDPALLRLEA